MGRWKNALFAVISDVISINCFGAVEPSFDTHAAPSWAVEYHTDTEFSLCRYAETPKQLLCPSRTTDTHTCARGHPMSRLPLIGRGFERYLPSDLRCTESTAEQAVLVLCSLRAPLIVYVT